MHTRRVEKEYWYKCRKPGCRSSFNCQLHLDIHNRIHENDHNICRYCPYRYFDPNQYDRHLKVHFRIRDYDCDQCDLKFVTKTELNHHYQRHEGIIYNCLICNIYEAISRRQIESHLRYKHGDIVGKNLNWGIMEHHVKIKQNILST